MLKRFWNWLKSFFIGPRYNIYVTYDSEWGNDDDKIFHEVRKIIKQTQYELIFIKHDKKQVVIRSSGGLRYRIVQL